MGVWAFLTTGKESGVRAEVRRVSKNTITADVPVSASLETESGPATSSSGVSNRALEGVFIVAVFLSSTLLFMVQPLVARLLLPLAGGSSALWNTAMVFFQITLLLGYAYAHGSLRKVGARKHPFLHAPLLVVPFLVLPLAVPEGWTLPNDVAPSLWVLGVLALIVGLPFFALATTSPTLQVWFSSTDHPRAADPYFLYAAGNVGSVLALLGYPLVMEPMLSLKAQTRFWAIGYGLFVIACIAAGFLTRTRTAPTQNVVAEQLAPLTNARRLRWTFWGFVPSALMIGVTLHITTDLASFPLLWVVPLLLYLVTFIIAFGKDSLTRSKRAAVAVLVLAIPLAISGLAPSRWALYIIGLHLGFFFFAALLCHSRLADDRPPAGQLTEFFLILSIGGALGGIFASLLAPLVFDTVIEYPITIVLALLIAWQPVLVFPSIPNTDSSVTLDRSFFGVYRVDETVQSDNPVRWIVSGTTVHGGQFLENDDGFDGPISYYSPLGPVGRVMESAQPQKVGVIGLGAGGMARPPWCRHLRGRIRSDHGRRVRVGRHSGSPHHCRRHRAVSRQTRAERHVDDSYLESTLQPATGCGCHRSRSRNPGLHLRFLASRRPATSGCCSGDVDCHDSSRCRTRSVVGKRSVHAVADQ